MYKRTSFNLQHIAFLNATMSRLNDGLDPFVFAAASADEKRNALIASKRECEAKIAKLRLQITEANRRFTSRGGHGIISYDVLQKWTLDLERLKAIATSFDMELAKIKFELVSSKPKRDANFERLFFEMARKMLHREVYDRIVLATLHGIGEANA